MKAQTRLTLIKKLTVSLFSSLLLSAEARVHTHLELMFSDSPVVSCDAERDVEPAPHPDL